MGLFLGFLGLVCNRGFLVGGGFSLGFFFWFEVQELFVGGYLLNEIDFWLT